jgi:hypothetical protein
MSVEVQGFNLTDSTFAFFPESNPPALQAIPASFALDGTTAEVTIVIGPGAAIGQYVLVATNPGGSSDSTPGPENTHQVLSPGGDQDGDGLSNSDELVLYLTDLFNPDTDGDGFSDGEEVELGLDALDPNSNPTLGPNLLPAPDRIIGGVISVVNIVDPFAGNQPPMPSHAMGQFISVLNAVDPTGGSQPPAPNQVAGPFVSVENTMP